MKTWTQDMLPLKIIKDLGLLKATLSSKETTRFIEFECPQCKKPFRATPSKVKTLTVKCCGICGNRNRAPQINRDLNTKECTVCKEIKHLDEYYKNSKRHDNYSPRCKTCMDAYKQSWTVGKENDIKLRNENTRLLQRYNITSEDYKVLLHKQDYCCAICGNAPEEGRASSKKLSVDHCHTTGAIRGLLCQKCNTALGLFNDSAEIIKKALNYLGT